MTPPLSTSINPGAEKLNGAKEGVPAPHPPSRSRALARPLIPVTLALMAGIAAPAWGVHLPTKWLAGGLILVWVSLGLLWCLGRPARLLPLLFFWLLGVAFYQQAAHPIFPPHHLVYLPQDQDLTLMGHLHRPGKMGGGERAQLFLEAEAWRNPEGWRAATGKLLVLGPPGEALPVGTGLVVKGRLRLPGILKNPGTFDRPRYLAADQIFREMRLKDAPGHFLLLASAEAYPLGEKLRGGIRRLLRDLDPASRAIYLAMLLGDQGEVTPEMRQNFARTGTSHLLVINGLHLGMVAAVTYFLSFWLLRRFPWLLLRLNVVKTATLLAAFPVVAYAWVAGGSPSTQRAEIMVLAYLLLVFLGRPREVWSALALAALVILSLTPLRLFAISFQLSFVAVAALIYLVPRLVKIAAAGERPSPGWLAHLWFRGKEWLAVSAVATLATAPLVAAYFQVVSLLGILVNLVAIPLVLVLALPLGEAAVFAQALSLTPVAQGLLAVGRLPLWLGYQAVALGARVPGSAIIVPTPTWLQVAAYYLLVVLMFFPRRNYLTWSGAGLAALVLLGSVAVPAWQPVTALEVTCLDSYGGLHGVVVTPEGRRLVFSAPGPSWPGKGGGGGGPLPGYCHWRQFRRLELVTALQLSQDNAGELLTLARQFQVGGFWYGRRGWEGPAYWDLWNYLGDRGAAPRSLEFGRPPAALGSVDLRFVKLGQEEGWALQLSHQGMRALILPPVRRLQPGDLPPAGDVALGLLVMPGELAAGEDGGALISYFKPGQVVLYGGSRGRSQEGAGEMAVPCHVTGKGAVSAYLSAGGVKVEQWRP